jgi:oligopeptide/dipeptide ABC transporter ATP-binding protein
MNEPPDRQTLLAVSGISKAFRLGRGFRSRAPRLVALDGVDLAVQRGEVVGVVGESGSGKTTLAKVIVRLEEPDQGSVLLHGQELLEMRGKELAAARRRVQLIYQDPYSSLNPRFTVGSAVAEPARVHGLIARGQEESYARELLSRVGLPERTARQRPRTMSGGQRQRVAIARALATQPELLVADEAVSALDVSIQLQILDLFAELRAELNVSIIFIGHQLSVVSYLADRVAVMYLGRVVETGPTAEVFGSPAHPYTLALIKAQPGRHRRSAGTRPAISGEIPSGLAIPTGCRFRNRCPFAEPICAEVDPEPVLVSPAHTSWCHVMPRQHAQNVDKGERQESLR